MISTRKEKENMTIAERFVREKREATAGLLRADECTFLDEIYRFIEHGGDALRNFGAVQCEFIDERTPVSSDFYRELARRVKEISSLNLSAIAEIYARLQTTSDALMSAGESISNSLSVCEELLRAVEGTIKKKMTNNSVKDEILIYDSIISDTYSGESTLAIDYRGGYITLGIESYERIWYDIREIRCNRVKGKIMRPPESKQTLDFFTDGYFNSRTFSAQPLFENSLDTHTSAINDGRLDTTYSAEYNSTFPTTSFKMTLTLAPIRKASGQSAGNRIDQILITLDPGDRTSVTSARSITPYLERLIVNNEDKTAELVDNTITVRGATIGEYERPFLTRSPAVFPTGSYLVCAPNVETITIDLVADVPQEIWYPEKIVKNDTGNEIYTFNYFQTLILNNYYPPAGRPDPRDLYPLSEINEWYAILASAHTHYDRRVPLFRYFIGIKDIALFAATYKTTGEFVTKNLNTYQDRLVAAVELYVNEIVPPGAHIRYYISHDKLLWHEISPLTRALHETLPTRIVYNGIDLKPGDSYSDLTSASVYMKVVMHGERESVPRLKSYAVRIKLQ